MRQTCIDNVCKSGFGALLMSPNPTDRLKQRESEGDSERCALLISERQFIVCNATLSTEKGERKLYSLKHNNSMTDLRSRLTSVTTVTSVKPAVGAVPYTADLTVTHDDDCVVMLSQCPGSRNDESPPTTTHPIPHPTIY